MLRMLLLMLGVGFLSVGLTTTLRAQEGEEAPDAECEKCMLIEAGLGEFCDDHTKGAAFGVQLTSKKLFDALQGTRLDRAQVNKCPGCKAAAEVNGKCDKCNLYISVPRGYKSGVAHALAKGREVNSDAAFQCDSCKKGWADNGSCTVCNHFFAAHRMFKSEDAQKAGLAAHKTLTQAAGAKCEACAVAMVTDGSCKACNVSFKEGKKVKG